MAKYNNVEIGRVALSIPHTNYRQNERILHNMFSQSRIGNTELFDIPFNDFNSLDLKYENDFNKDRRAEAFIDFVMRFVKGEFNDVLNNPKDGRIINV